MKIFNKRTNPQTAALEQLVERQAKLNIMRSEAQTGLDVALANRQSHLISGDVGDIKVAEALQGRADGAESALLGLDDALAALKIQIADAEAAVSAEQRRIKCEADAVALKQIIAKVETKIGPFLEISREMAELLSTLNNFRYQVGGVSNYLGNVASETQVALRLVLDDLNGAVDAVARGEQEISIGTIAPRPAAIATPAPEAKDTFTYTTPQSHGPGYRVPVSGAFAKEKN
jgi:hypothetical protein